MLKTEKRKYAQALRRLELGVWGYPLSLFRVVTLTTREGGVYNLLIRVGTSQDFDLVRSGHGSSGCGRIRKMEHKGGNGRCIEQYLVLIRLRSLVRAQNGPP